MQLLMVSVLNFVFRGLDLKPWLFNVCNWAKTQLLQRLSAQQKPDERLWVTMQWTSVPSRG